jgi:hypothetical protein
MRITEQFLNVLLICCREKLQHVWDFYTLTRVCVCVCVCVCVRVRVRVCVDRFPMSSGHWAERDKEYHMSVCNDILDNAFCVHGNKMVNLNSTMVPAI